MFVGLILNNLGLFVLMKWLFFILVFILTFGLVSATVSEVVIVDDIGSFSGAVLRIKSAVDGEPGDKIYAVEFLTGVGIIKFDIETALSEVWLDIIMTKDGAIIDVVSEGPFVVNGSEILIDRREKEVAFEVIKKAPVVEEVVDELVKEEIVEEVMPIVVEDVVEDDLLKNKLTGFFMTGKAVFIEDDGSFDFGFSLGGVFLILFFGLFIFMIVRRGKKFEKEVLCEDDKELAYMENKVKIAEAEIAKIKTQREKKVKTEDMKIRLAKDEKKLNDLEKKERQDSEIIEDL